MFLSVMSCQLGGDRVDVNQLVLSRDSESLKRLAKTGFDFVYWQENDTPAKFMAEGAMAKIDGFDPSKIDSMIVVSSIFDSAPSWAQEVALVLGIPASSDIIRVQEACTGYVTAVALADGMIQSGRSEEVLIVTFDIYSSYMSGDLSLEILFSDALTLSTVSKSFPKSHVPSNALHLNLKRQRNVSKRASETDLNILREQLQMNGAAVFQFAIDSVPKLVSKCLADIQVSSTEVAWYLHQGSKFVVDHLSQALELESDSHFRAGAYGNTVSGSIPFQLTSHYPKSEYLGLVGFGMGLSAKVAVYEIENN